MKRLSIVLIFAGIAGACGFNNELREYLYASFWQPFAKHPHQLKGPAADLGSPFAGMGTKGGDSPIERLRTAYQQSAWNDFPTLLAAAKTAAARPRNREEIDLLDAKADLRRDDLTSALTKLEAFLTTATSEDYLSEARGWRARVFFLQGNQSAAGKIYLDELARAKSNLSRQTLLNSLQLVYGYTGGDKLREQLAEYFDTPGHAAFAINLVTNPRWRPQSQYDPPEPLVPEALPYEAITSLLESHRDLFRSEEGSKALALLGMRTAVRSGDPAAAVRIAVAIPSSAAVRSDPDFLWMLGSAHFLSGQYAEAVAPLVRLWNTTTAPMPSRAAAAYGLLGVYTKTHNIVEAIRFGSWLRDVPGHQQYLSFPSSLTDQSIYWASSGFDLAFLLETEASMDDLRAFLKRHPQALGARRVKYALAVRLARARKYAEAAEIYESIRAKARTERMRHLAGLTDKIEVAKYLCDNPERIFFNDTLWHMMQRYAMFADHDARLTKAEREHLISAERRLKDEQEERWQAYLLLREVPGGEARRLARHCLLWINTERFGREEEINNAPGR